MSETETVAPAPAPAEPEKRTGPVSFKENFSHHVHPSRVNFY